MAQVKITMKGPLFKKGPLLANALGKSALKIAKVVEITAQNDYLSKKKATPKLPSMVWQSFKIDLPFSSASMAKAIVVAGGPQAPWAIYVDQPRKGFPGYFFMKTGRDAGEAKAPEIIKQEFKKIGGV